LGKALPFFYYDSIPKNGYFSKEGRISDRVGFVITGIMRSFFHVEGKEISTFFLFPGNISVALLSFLEQRPAIENIQAMEDTELLVIKRKDLYNLYHENWKWQQVGRVLIERYYVQMERRAIMLQANEAKDRYRAMVKDFPELLQNVPLHYLASYLGVSPETLSRIRRQYTNE